MKNIYGTETKNENGLEIDDKAIQRLFRDRHEEIKGQLMFYAYCKGYSTQDEIAAAVCVSREFLNGVLNGRRKCPIDLLQRLSKELNFDVSELFNLDRALKDGEIKTHEDLLHAYLLSFGITFNNHGDAVLKDHNGSYKHYDIIPALEFKKLLQQIEATTKALIENAFINTGYSSTRQND